MKTLFYKEWIKTRWYLLLAFLFTNGFVGYALLRIHRVIGLKGVAHLWEVMITRDAIFVDLLCYIPLIAGILLAVVQFVPEMYHKCLKLTLHLPVSQLRMVSGMLIYGVVILGACFALNLLILYGYLQSIMPHEMYNHVLLTALPWYLAGLCAYLLVSWVCLEPTWKMRIVNGIISVFILRVFYLSTDPEAYTAFLPWLAVFTVLTLTFSWNSIERFKSGKQD